MESKTIGALAAKRLTNEIISETIRKLLTEYSKDENADFAKRLTILALQKQIPKKPTFEGDGYADGAMVYDTWICPNCGQAIDWSEEE